MKNSLESRLNKLEKTVSLLPRTWFYDSITEKSADAERKALDAGIKGGILVLPATMSAQDWQEAATKHMAQLQNTMSSCLAGPYQN